jgi:hypothetical protein
VQLIAKLLKIFRAFFCCNVFDLHLITTSLRDAPAVAGAGSSRSSSSIRPGCAGSHG